MDRQSRTADIIKAYNNFKITQNEAAFIKNVCLYFDMAKRNALLEKDLNLLLFLANKVGIPQYYSMLESKFNAGTISDENMNLLSFGSIVNEASLYSNGKTLHKYQKKVLERFKEGQKNRFLLTAPTSFGKTFTTYEIINKMKNYKNILLIFPSISLLSENYLKVKKYDFLKDYNIYSLSEEEFDKDNKNIFIFTPERYLSFIDKNKNINFDFAFIDEMYKIDNGFTIDDKTSENERDVSYRIALEFVCQMSRDILLAGPYMTLPNKDNLQKCSLLSFAELNAFEFLEYNDFEIVDKQYYDIKAKQSYLIDGNSVEIGNVPIKEKISRLLKLFASQNENSIIYCSRKSKTEEYAKDLYSNTEISSLFNSRCNELYKDRYEAFLTHIESVFGDDWCVLKALKARIGIHHGLIPKYIQKEIIHLFNKNVLICLFSTTTITEGVNTNAKNIIITSKKKGTKPLKQFDAKNIAGRAGRFLEHYVGRVIDLNNQFENIINSQPEIIEHKNYDIASHKDEVDYQITKDEYLSEEDKFNKKSILKDMEQLNIPEDVFSAFKVINPRDKIKLYFKIQKLLANNLDPVKRLSHCLILHNMQSLDWDAFEEIVKTFYPIIKEEKLKSLIDIKVTQGTYSLLTVLLASYLRSGFMGMVDYNTTERINPLNKDEAIRRVADCVYNIFKYTLVKYLGIFDVFYKYQISIKNKTNMDDIAGLGNLIKKLEYNALSPDARKLSDFGVPFKLVQFYDSNIQSKKHFDNYETLVDAEITTLLY